MQKHAQIIGLWYPDDDLGTGIGFTRKYLQVKTLNVQSGHLKADMPKYRISNAIGPDWPKTTTSVLLQMENKSPLPIWRLCGLATRIAGNRYELQWACAQNVSKRELNGRPAQQDQRRCEGPRLALCLVGSPNMARR